MVTNGREKRKNVRNATSFYSKIDEFLAEEEALEQQRAFKTHVNRVLAAADRKGALLKEIKVIYRAMPRGSVFVLYVVIAFIFAMLLSVI